MQIVIGINENDYKTLMINGGNCSVSMAERIVDSVFKGKKLPKGHGDLIDINELEPDTEWNDYEDGFISYSRNQIKCAKVIIEADNADNAESERNSMSEWMPIDTALTTLKLYSTYSDPVRKYDCRWSKDVLLCDRNKDIRVGYWLASKYLRGWQVYGSKNYEPIAWMPLPQPYRAENEDKEIKDEKL